MSHFTVLVIGENPEDQLAPYNENLENCENAKWDWYELGGRWIGFFKLKEKCLHEGITDTPGILTTEAKDGWVDQACKGAIDFEGMRDDAAAKALARWDLADVLLGDLRSTFTTWEKLIEKYGDNMEMVRNLYHQQPAIIALKAENQFSWNCEDVFCTREEMEARARANAISTFAVVKDGKWYERGEMGWWGIVIDGKDCDTWNEEVNKLINETSRDTLLSLYDCHI